LNGAAHAQMSSDHFRGGRGTRVTVRQVRIEGRTGLMTHC
jgi:hypothetical protein